MIHTRSNVPLVITSKILCCVVSVKFIIPYYTTPERAAWILVVNPAKLQPIVFEEKI